ncbi:MAG: glycosyltransferase, partial [Stackebrandtia sp.]
MRTAPRQQFSRAIAPCRGRGTPRRVAMLSMHTSPLEQPGTGDAGGMNVYVLQTARRLADRGVAVEIFTRATSSEQPPAFSPSEGITVHYIPAGPFEGLSKNDLPSQLCAFTSGVLRAEASKPAGYFDVIHSHYWLSGQAAWLAAERWGVPHVHSAHTLAKIKNLHLADSDTPEPFTRVVGEQQVVAESDALVTNTSSEAEVLVDLYRADPRKVTVTPPGVDPEVFTPGDRQGARRRLGLPDDALVIGFAGRIQPLKAPDVLVRAVARLRTLNPSLA